MKQFYHGGFRCGNRNPVAASLCCATKPSEDGLRAPSFVGQARRLPT